MLFAWCTYRTIGFNILYGFAHGTFATSSKLKTVEQKRAREKGAAAGFRQARRWNRPNNKLECAVKRHNVRAKRALPVQELK